jgi:hypothetical protein
VPENLFNKYKRASRIVPLHPVINGKVGRKKESNLELLGRFIIIHDNKSIQIAVQIVDPNSIVYKSAYRYPFLWCDDVR